MHKMRKVGLLFRVWATQTAAAVLTTKRKCKLALQEWRNITVTHNDQRDAYIARKQTERLLLVFKGWETSHVCGPGRQGVEEESFNRQDNSTLSRGDSGGGAQHLRVGDDKHDVGSISGMTEGPHSKLDESSVLQASFASVSSSKASYRNGVNGTPQRSVINAPTRKIPARTCPRVSSGYGQTPNNLGNILALPLGTISRPCGSCAWKT